MLNCFIQEYSGNTPISLFIVTQSAFGAWINQQSEEIQHWVKASGFIGNEQTFCLLPKEEAGAVERVLVGIGEKMQFHSLMFLPLRLPEGIYQFAAEQIVEFSKQQAAMAWGLGAYQFTRYKKPKRAPAVLYWAHDSSELNEMLLACYQVRDLINTPAEDLAPHDLAAVVESLAKEFQAEFNKVVGEDLITQNFPALYAVGRGSHNHSHLIELNWGEENAPRVALVGKGICFDSGGLDIKPASGMLTMKKDMGGAAHAIALARLIMSHQLPVRLHLVISAAENAISSYSYRPGDVINTRKGLTVEIGNTDAEGRVVLSDAFALVSEQQPELMIDFATLTGAARIALGAEIAAYFTNNERLAADFQAIGEAIEDPVWRLPIYSPYRKLLDSSVADINNAAPGGLGGAITAALFLQEFVGQDIDWLHLDIMAWNNSAHDGKPEGGEAMGLRAVFQYLMQRYNKN